MKKLFLLILVLGIFGPSPSLALAQDQPTQQPTTEELEKEQAEREKNAFRLLELVIDEAQSLRLTENRVRVQISAADILWDHNQGRARSLFSMAAEGVAELERNSQPARNQRGGSVDVNGFTFSGFVGPPNRRSFQLRQELVLTAARHDAALAYQLLAATKPATQNQGADQRGPLAQFTSEDSLEQTLLGRIAALDPKLAAQNAEQMLAKGQFPRALTDVINNLQSQDPEAAARLADKTVKRIQSANLLTNNEAGALAQALLTPGPRAAGSSTNTETASKLQSQVRGPVLDQSVYVDLLSTVIDSALKAAPGMQSNQRGPTNSRARVPGGAGGGSAQNSGGSQATEAQIEQSNARRLLAGLQITLPLIDQYLPARSTVVRQKMAEFGLGNTSPLNTMQTLSALRGNPTSDALVQAAASAPPQMQSRIYQQAAFQAIAEGNTDRARQIASDHLSSSARDSVMQRIDFRELARKAEGARFDEIRQTLGRLPSDNQKIDLLLQLAGDAQKTDPKLTNQLLEEARQITSHRAASYEHFEQQLKVAHAFASVDPARSFEVLDPGISQLNELLSAAAVLSGFEINMFQDGEMTMQNGNGLTATINRYGQELALLARTDFAGSETLAGRFQFTEPRIMTRLSIVQGLLGVQSSPQTPNSIVPRVVRTLPGVRPE